MAKEPAPTVARIGSTSRLWKRVVLCFKGLGHECYLVSNAPKDTKTPILLIYLEDCSPAGIVDTCQHVLRRVQQRFSGTYQMGLTEAELLQQ